MRMKVEEKQVDSGARQFRQFRYTVLKNTKLRAILLEGEQRTYKQQMVTKWKYYYIMHRDVLVPYYHLMLLSHLHQYSMGGHKPVISTLE